MFFDVGSNLGQYVFRFRNFAASGVKIYAFEPVQSNYAEVKRKLKNSKNVVLENIALSDNAGSSVLFIPLIDGIEIDTQASLNLQNRRLYYNDFREQTVEVSTLDDYCRKNQIQKIDLLKIDTEGNDPNVIAGGKDIISSSMPVIMAEDIIGTDAFEYLSGLGYIPFYADKNSLLSPYDSEKPELVKDLLIMIPGSRQKIFESLLTLDEYTC